ncbi:MAG: hypothetical protein M3405_01880 [Acidobacteriota bacterium]|jgi:uncharacterized coiled-coil DUF342 family protein|nr:hypothetical protein [Acidobacteriota bacterium]
MKKLNDIKIKLDSTNVRLSELTQMRDETNNKLETAQNGFIDGKATIEAVQSEQGRLDTLKASIKALESKKDETEKELEAATDAENLKSSLAKLKALSEDADAAFNLYDSLRVQLGETIEAEVEKILAKSAEFYAKRRDHDTLLKQVKAKHPDEKSLNSAYSEFINLTPCKFGESIVIAERLAANTKQQKINQASRADDTASRADA